MITTWDGTAMSEISRLIRLIRLEIVLERRGKTKSAYYRGIAKGVEVPGIKRNGGKAGSVWPAHEIELLNRAEAGGASADEMRDLVRQLIARRAQMRQEIAAA